jgi:hypothetical protein
MIHVDDFHPTRSELPKPRAPRLRFDDALLDYVPEDPHWEDFGTASSLRSWGWST